jgi:hypothetical protein
VANFDSAQNGKSANQPSERVAHSNEGNAGLTRAINEVERIGCRVLRRIEYRRLVVELVHGVRTAGLGLGRTFSVVPLRRLYHYPGIVASVPAID